MIAMIRNLFIEVLGQLNIYYGEGVILAIAVLSTIYLFVSEKEIRRKLIYPTILILGVVLNPLTYYVIKSSLSSYWRIFWLIPDAILIALAAAKLVSGMPKLRFKLLTMAVLMILLVFFGKNIFKSDEFGKRYNQYGLSTTAIWIADAMLEADETPRCICPYTMTWHLRAYNPDIETMYGRDIDGYIVYTTPDRTLVSHNISAEEPDYDVILDAAVKGDFKFVIAYDRAPIDDVTLFQYGFEYYRSIDGYEIYMQTGEPIIDPDWTPEEE